MVPQVQHRTFRHKHSYFIVSLFKKYVHSLVSLVFLLFNGNQKMWELFFPLIFYFILHNLGWLDQILIFKRSGYIIETLMGNCAKEEAFCFHYLTWYRFSKHRVGFEEESTQEIVIFFSWTIQLDKNWHFQINKFITIFSEFYVFLLLPVMSLHFCFFFPLWPSLLDKNWHLWNESQYICYI